MADTNQFALPLLAAAQAQKHVTVNEALARLDALAQMRLESVSQTVPPIGIAEGTAYGVPVGGVNDWNLHDGEVAIFANGGWVFVAPKAGWRAHVVDQAALAVHDGSGWIMGAAAFATGGAATLFSVREFDHVIAAGASSTTQTAILAGEQVIGITGRVIADITGAGLTGWELGVAGATNRYGSGLGLAAPSWVRGLTGSPLTYWSDTALELTATGGSFAAGTVRLAVHTVALALPHAV